MLGNREVFYNVVGGTSEVSAFLYGAEVWKACQASGTSTAASSEDFSGCAKTTFKGSTPV